MPPVKRERFNAKARQSSVGSSHKKRKKGKASNRRQIGAEDSIVEGGSNAFLIDPQIETARREADRKRRELLAYDNGEVSNQPISFKKRKRLDAYITRQLKKENRQKLMADLANSSSQVQDRSTLMSAATLGTGKVLTGQERLKHDYDKVERIEQRRRGKSYTVEDADISDSDIEEGTFAEGSDMNCMLSGEISRAVAGHDAEREARIVAARSLSSVNELCNVKSEAEQLESDTPSMKNAEKFATTMIGSALATGSDGKILMPTMRQRNKPAKKRLVVKTAWGRTYRDEETESEGSSFDSSESDEDNQLRSSNDQSGKSASLTKPVEEDVETDKGDIDGSVSSLSVGTASNESDSTDDEEKAVLEEAMRRRGMLGDPNRSAPDFDFDDEQGDGGFDDQEADFDNSALKDCASAFEEIPYATFDEKEDTINGEESDIRENLSEAEISDDSCSDGEDDTQRSHRRSLPQKGKSSGFKDWAKKALGLAQREDNLKDDELYRGPEPVAGLSVKVKDLMDGKIRGPLGEKEVSMQSRSAFAQKFFEEAAKRTQDGRAIKDRVVVNRDTAIQESRMMLPTLAEEERIVRTIMENMVTVLCGETGSGKTTQVPQFLYEAGFGSSGSSNPGMVGITQPRRVAALSMASRVAKELNVSSSIVSYQIRYDATVNASTRLKFMTDGVLLRELATDFLLSKYSAIIIDEAHERSVNTDVLIGVLSRIVNLRAKNWIEGQGMPLRMIVMSATLRVEDFIANTRLFDNPPPVIEIDSRQYPVVTHFNRRTSHDYVTESIKKACKIHARLPPGGILIFLTGQAEISVVCRKLEKRYGKRAAEERRRKQKQRRSREGGGDGEDVMLDKVALPARIGDVEAEEIDLSLQGQSSINLALDIDDGLVEIEDAEALDSDIDEDEIEYDADLPTELRDDTDVAMHILPLYSLLPSDQQMRVFEQPPAKTRLVIVATNVAETSLTIPGITYVVDCGRSKERKYDAITNTQSFEIGFISKASANQRAGRAGRTGPGHCYRLYSSNVYEQHFESFAQPEILRTPVDNLVLMMKAMNIDNVSNFPFPTPPDRDALQRAEKLLLRLGALEVDRSDNVRNTSQYKVTELGRLMSLFPLSSRLSKLLVQGHQFDCLPYVIALVAALSVGEPFSKEQSLHEIEEGSGGVDKDEEEEEINMSIESQYLHNQTEIAKEKRKVKRGKYFRALNQFAALGGAMSDPLRLLNAVGAYEHAGGTVQFCQDNFLIPKAMQEIHKLRAQLSTMVQGNAEPGHDWSHLNTPKFVSPPSEKQLTVLRQFLAASFIDQVAIRADLAPESAARIPMLQESSSSDHHIAKQFHHQTRNGAKMKSTRDVAYLAMGVAGEACFIHNSSVLYHQAPPEWIVYSEVFRGRNRGDLLDVPGKIWLKGVTKINPHWIYKLGKSLCSFSKIIHVDPKDTRLRLIEATKELKRRQGNNDKSFLGDKQIYIVPTYGNGPALDTNERSSHSGWELPAVSAKQSLVGGKWITDLL